MRALAVAFLLAACGSGASSTPDAPASIADAAVAVADARPAADAPPPPADASVPDAPPPPPPDAPPPPPPDAGITQLRGSFTPVTAHGESRSQGHVLRITAPAAPAGTMSGPGGTLELRSK